MPKIISVIICGGTGTRLWPLSRSAHPKQFFALSPNGFGKSLFQEAILRHQAIANQGMESGQMLIVASESHRFLILDQLQDLKIDQATLLLEPCGRNTSPALTLAALCAISNEDDPILVVTPADQTIGDNSVFIDALQDCINLVNADIKNQSIAIMGVTPTTPNTGYGYIKRNEVAGMYNDFEVKAFVEKPDLRTAEDYLISGEYFWNSGIFVLRASTWLAALSAFRPDIYKATQIAWEGRVQEKVEQALFIRPDMENFKTIPPESIDYAVMERCPSSKNFAIKMIELQACWNDLGSWDAVWQVGKKDSDGNVIDGDVLIENTENSLMHSSGRLICAIGVQNLIIVETADAVLVADRSDSQDVKNVVARLGDQGRDEKLSHRKVVRPWGWYDSLDEGDFFKVKRIFVRPGASLSLQKHHHRAEHWIIVKGIAQIVNGDQTFTLKENQSTYIPIGQIHRLANPGDIPLEIIEVQTGGHLSEDDIIRFDDVYGRN